MTYDLDERQGVRNPRSLWEVYQDALAEARDIVAKNQSTLGAYGGVCKLCHWYTACLDRLSADDDLTLIPQLGRAKRDVMVGDIGCIADLVV